MDQEQKQQDLTLKQRNNLIVTGVMEVISFDDTAVVLKTELGDLTVQGQGLQLKELSVAGSQTRVEGAISALIYEDPRTTGGWLHRLLG